MLTMTNNDIPLNIYTQTFCVSLAPQKVPMSEYIYSSEHNYYDYHISMIILILYNTILLVYYYLFIYFIFIIFLCLIYKPLNK